MLYTLTMNAAIDLNLTCMQIESEKVNRVSESAYSPNGKAINVSIVLDHFGVDSVAMGIFGGFTGKHIVDCLKEKGINVHPFFIDGRTRINVFVNDDNKEYKFVSKGGHVSQGVKDDILASIRGASDMEYLVVSGSLPPGVEPEYLDQIMVACEDNNVEVIIDISHKHLSSLLSHKPLLIKPNDEELLSVFGLRAETHAEAQDSLGTLHSLGAQNILLTLGSKGMYFSNGDSIHFCNAPEIKLHSSACAGDSSLAAFLSIWLKNELNIQHAMKTASAVGADVASSSGIGELKLFQQLINKTLANRIA
ncbi:1-phosphofructokinase family hexose kinase [Vibrio mediterranei]|uniref:1-phosphofructokinase family hexose kinase n=1 Tax=Vibrio mediterranei TaxID=689 RepID=UPI001EFD3747|nr:1-phosphofructokinase family hexose kinase [Vibrio mediterranei]MCG9628097.1 1-phosphofructokinase family hexose kinase [Vibrio mediterranei]